MIAAEVILRLGGALGGWLIFVAHGLVIASIPEADCNPDGDAMWKGTLFLGLLDGFGTLLLARGLAWRKSLRWLALPAVPLAIYGCWRIAPAVVFTTLEGASLCRLVDPGAMGLEGLGATPIQRVWPLVQIGVLAMACGSAARYWRGEGARERHV